MEIYHDSSKDVWLKINIIGINSRSDMFQTFFQQGIHEPLDLILMSP